MTPFEEYSTECFDREFTLRDLLRGIDGERLLAALRVLLEKPVRLVDADGENLIPQESEGETKPAAGIPLRGELETIGALEADVATERLRAAADLVELMLQAGARYLMTSNLYKQTQQADYEELQKRHAALEKSEARYKALAETLEQRVKEQVKTIETTRLKLYQSEKLASVGRLAAGIAHEINNSLTILIASLESLGMLVAAQTAASGGGEATKLVADARAGAARIASIVRDLSGFTRADGAPGPVDLRAVLGSCVRMLRAQVRPRARLVVTEGPVPAIMGTEARLSQVVFNLLLNAAQAVPEGRPDENQIHVSLSARDGNVVLAVSDTGVGIAEGERERVFEPFYTTKAHGTGLGLFVTRSIVEEFGGAVRVSENTPRGATFTVTFPSSNESPRARRRTTPRGMARGRVLIVDDEPLIAQSLARLLRPLASISADGAERALEIFEGDREFDLVLCDLMMPGKSGIDLFEAARARWPELEERFVFMTGGVYTERAREFVARVDNTLLEKPITKEALLSVITRIGRE